MSGIDVVADRDTLGEQLGELFEVEGVAAGTGPLSKQLDLRQSPPKVVLSFGLGADSTALLLRWINDPTSRDFQLSELAVVTAMVGDEWDVTGTDVSEVILPLLRKHQIRFIQAGRGQRRIRADGTGVRVFEDSRCPQKLHFSGDFRLSDELLAAGTIPQVGSARLCSVHAKGEVLDPVIKAITKGQRYRHVIGFESGELVRAKKDTTYNTETRAGEYPLIDWGWDRTAALDYIKRSVGRRWNKSACVFCPFALTTASGRAATLERYAAHPQAGARMLYIEHVALALNPRQGLVAGRRAIDYVRAAGLTEVIELFQQTLDAVPHTLYEVRRLTRRNRSKPESKGTVVRSVRSTGPAASRVELLEVLRASPTKFGIGWDDHRRPILADTKVTIGDDGILRRYVAGRDRFGDSDVEQFLVTAPAVVEDKQMDGFESWWQEATGADLSLFAMS